MMPLTNSHRVPALVMLMAGLLLSPARADEASLGRLFFTHEERAGLDLERLTGVAGSGGAQAIKLNGIARKQSGGSQTVWLNGKPWHQSERLTGVVPASDPARASVRSAEGSGLEVKVGETADRVTGLKYAPLAPGSIVVHRK